MPHNHKIHLRNIEALTKLLDNQFEIFGFKFGIDPILGFIPWLGDALPAIISTYLIGVAIQTKMPTHRVLLMVGHVLLDFVLGSVPFLGNFIDFFYKSNARNYTILRAHLLSIEGESTGRR